MKTCLYLNQLNARITYYMTENVNTACLIRINTVYIYIFLCFVEVNTGHTSGETESCIERAAQ